MTSSGVWVRMQILIAALVMTAIGAAAPALADPLHVGALRTGDAIFWDGPFIESAGLRSPTEPVLCHGATGTTIGCLYTNIPPTTVPVCLPDACIEYTIDVMDSEGTLRVALDHETTDNRFTFALVDPTGVPATWAFDLVPLSLEREVPQPATGSWTIQVFLHSVQRSGFRMRAYLEPPLVPSTEVVATPPNLQINPPFDLTFDGCQLTETVQHAAQRCLRFSTGPNNAGRGALDIRIREFGLTGPEVQRVYSSDGTFTERQAGTFEYHVEHGHYHHVGTAGYQLYRVTDSSIGEMEKVGDGPKVGFCMGDTLIADWSSFEQEAQGGRIAECNGRVIGPPVPQLLEPVLNYPMFTLAAGWGDTYPYTVEGNYVEFGNGDGTYVVQVATDPDDTIFETDETDNLGYTYFTLTGDEITVIERGRGAHPWDPAKEVVNDIRRGVRS